MSGRWRDASILSLGMAAAAFLGGCETIGVAPPVTPALVAAGRGATEATLNTGREAFAGACTSCHTADPVGRHSMTKWREIVDDMAPRAKLDSAERTALLAYISAVHASVP
jgi:mono/diheme cytochrome c family protein